MLSNMFDPTTETTSGWDLEVRDDVIEEGNKHGGFLHIVVDKASPQGNVYVKCPNIATAVAAVNALHGRWFAGKVITAAYVPLVNYHNLFPDSVYSTQILTTRRWKLSFIHSFSTKSLRKVKTNHYLCLKSAETIKNKERLKIWCLVYTCNIC